MSPLSILLSLCYAMLCYAKSLQSCPTLCNPIDGSPPGSAFSGILQARILEWVAISFSNAWKWKAKVKFLSCVRLLATPWTAAYQAPLSMGFAKQEYWSGVPLPSLLLSLGPQFLCVLGFRAGNPSVPRRPLSVVFSCEHAVVVTMCPLSLLNKVSIHYSCWKNAYRGCCGGFLASPHGPDKNRLPPLFPV